MNGVPGRDLVVCCDGTWQDAVDESNVRRFYDLLDLPEPQRRYVKGVGTGGLVDRLRGAVAATGLSDSLIEGYGFLVENYRPGDRISLFGFSRGAYVARSLAGMIGGIGIADGRGLDDDARAALVQRAYDRYRVLKDERKAQAGRAAGPEAALTTAPADDGPLPLVYDPGTLERPTPDIPVVLVGVWDTVGSLGIPSYIGVPDLTGSRERYEFLNVVLDTRIPHARHAVSLDEMRGPFRPTLWVKPPAGTTQDIRQVWFPGDHCDVGGGHPDVRLSQGALLWMVDEAAALGLPFRAAGRAALASAVAAAAPGLGLDAVHGMGGGLFSAFLEAAWQPRPRATPRVDRDRPEPDVAASAYELQKVTDGAERRYRPTRTLQPGEQATVTVAADQGWNATGLYLEPGRYRFAAQGRWSTPFGGSGPEGVTPWPVVGDGFGKVVGLVEKGLRAVLHNPEAELAGARREADEPLMVLVGLVADEVTDVDGQVKKPDEKVIIGAGATPQLRGDGYLWAYANDAWGYYGNNSGQVSLTVTRLGS